MELQGLHHITMITGDAQANVDFYADKLGLRLVKKTVNFDAPDAYHLYFGDEQGSPGTILTWFEFAGARRGRAGSGMIHVIQLGVASPEALDFWAARLDVQRTGDVVRFEDYDGLAYELIVSDREPRRAVHPEIPEAFAITGIAGARAYGQAGPHPLLTETLAVTEPADGFELGGFSWGYDAPPAERGLQGAGTVHHIAWASRDEDHRAWQRRGYEGGGGGTRGPGSGGCTRRARTSATSATATISSRSTSASRGGSCSRSPRSRPASRSTRTPSTSARTCGCRRFTSTYARSSSACSPRSRTRGRSSSDDVPGATGRRSGRGPADPPPRPRGGRERPARARRRARSRAPAARGHAAGPAHPRRARLPLVRGAARRLPRPRHVPCRLPGAGELP